MDQYTWHYQILPLDNDKWQLRTTYVPTNPLKDKVKFTLILDGATWEEVLAKLNTL